MEIGGALAEARGEAGLTVAQVSERTRIRATIIRDIERDDYAACGGDYYARGHIRAIAHVVGADPVPLIEEYDSAHMPPPVLPEPEHDLGGDRYAGDWLRSAARRAADGLAPVSDGGPAAGSRHPVPGNSSTVPGGITAAEAFRPSMPLQAGRTRRLPTPTEGLALVLLIVVGALIYLLVSGPSPAKRPSPGHAHRAAGSAPHSAGASTAKIAAAGRRAVRLVPIGATAFGPGGIGHGDAPQLASLAVDGSDRTAWHTDWYATADFGGLQPGTGLLLTLTPRAAVASARILLGPAAGGQLQLLAGGSPSLAALHVVAQSAITGGTLTMHIASPAPARYLLIWFTGLPADNSGTYQASIYNISLSGTS